MKFMKPKYDFSQSEQGKFYHPNSKFNFPIYLESDVEEFLTQLADQKNIDVSILILIKSFRFIKFLKVPLF